MLKQERALPKLWRKVENTLLSKTALYVVALIFPFIGTEGFSPNHENQHQNKSTLKYVKRGVDIILAILCI